ncbi:hypothetical protein BEWA_025370 [Theileria equi strain WA]|uniref:Ribosome recycling factor domain-containing protein n=1 Tax=Theileria equi strain WA TaxID=1537102 RepID=L0AWQ4_THEEQ|nr:hypothetical protein BEWA_025370 [Theileria equi strain WA]AFZ79688.1 hypothetical protein BEWA_025370 [Theileria equi strain WA]|eukprot:XP_004829354.1 hypothetical protein BEWA_025370 [Theileria equi strain WA]
MILGLLARVALLVDFIQNDQTRILDLVPTFGAVSGFRISSERSLGPGQFHIAAKRRNKLQEEEQDTAISSEDLEKLHNGYKTKLKDLEDYIENELTKIGIHRATPKLIDHIKVDIPKGKKELKHIARIVTNGNFELQVQPFSETYLNPIFCALSLELKDYKVKLLIDHVSVTIPTLGPEVQNQAEATIKKHANDMKTDIRIIRQNAMKALKALESGLSDDMKFTQKNLIENNCKVSSEKIEKMCNNKIKQLNSL